MSRATRGGKLARRQTGKQANLAQTKQLMDRCQNYVRAYAAGLQLSQF